MIPRLSPDEAPVVDVARGLDNGTMTEQAHSVLVEAAYGVGYHKEHSNVEGFEWASVLAA